MRFARWVAEGVVFEGVVARIDGVDRLVAFDEGETVLGLTRLGLEDALVVAEATLDRHAEAIVHAPDAREVQLLPPIDPPAVRDFVAFEEHVEGVVRSVGGDGEGEVVGPLPTAGAPRTPFNATISPHRRFAFRSVPLSLVKDIKNALGATVNDVVMAVCAGGLRTWLQDHDALPEAALLSMFLELGHCGLNRRGRSGVAGKGLVHDVRRSLH
jgi:hypothetical protein